MASELAEGTYKVFLAGNSALALDTTGASRGNGANVRVLTYDYDSDGMVFEVFKRADGTYRILSRFSGKALDTADTPAAGANVKQWTSRDTRDQSWDVTDTGETATWKTSGGSYPAYTVSIDRARILSDVDGEGSVTLADATGDVESIAIYGGFAEGGQVVDSVTVGTIAHAMPTYLAALPSGIADCATWDARGLTVQRNVGVMTAFDPDDQEQVELAGDDWASSTGALDAGATVYYALEQDDDIEQQAEDAEVELDEEEPAGMAKIESYPDFPLPTVSAGDAVIVPVAGAYLSASFWAEEAASETLYMTAASAKSKANVSVEKAATDTGLQRWIFVPLPDFESGACYEIRSYANMREILSSNGTSNGANVYVLADSNANTQRWVLTEESDGKWTAQNVASRRFLDVSGGKAKNGQNVRIWNDNTSNAQNWHIESYGTTTYDGQACHIVKFVSWVTDPTDTGKTHYNLDVNGASKSVSNKSNVCIYQDDDSADQRWVLVRTTAVDSSIGVPDSLTACWNVAGTSKGLTHGIYGGKHTFYPYFQAADNWLATNSANNYQLRWRTRYMDSDTGKWGSWSSYNVWRTRPCYIIDYYADKKRRGKSGWGGEQAWMTDGITVQFDLQDSEDEDGIVTQGSKAAEVQYGVRCVGAGSKSNVVGNAAYQTVRMCWGPAMSLSEVAWSPSGYNVVFGTDYDKGQWTVYLDELKVNGSDVISKAQEFKGLSGLSGTGFVNVSGKAGSIPAEGSTVYARWRCRTDLFTAGMTYTGTVQLKWNSGHGETAAPEVKHNETSLVDTATVEHTKGAKTRMWMRWHDPDSGWRFKELSGKANGTKTVFSAVPPEQAYQLWTTVVTDNDNWATSLTEVKAWTGMKCHIWTSGTSTVARLALREGEPLSLQVGLSADADTVKLNKRAYETVRFGNTRSKELTVVGEAYLRGTDAQGNPVWGEQKAHPSGMGLSALKGYVDLSNFEGMVGKHLVYRSPWGHIENVAVTGVDYDTARYKAEVTVKMTVEGV